jgi:hypothetical protein
VVTVFPAALLSGNVLATLGKISYRIFRRATNDHKRASIPPCLPARSNPARLTVCIAMKKLVSVLLFAALALAGCATHYDITLTNGEILTAFGKPKHDEAKHIYIYKDAQGVVCGVLDFKVTLIQPSSDRKSASSQFIAH